MLHISNKLKGATDVLKGHNDKICCILIKADQIVGGGTGLNIRAGVIRSAVGLDVALALLVEVLDWTSELASSVEALDWMSVHARYF